MSVTHVTRLALAFVRGDALGPLDPTEVGETACGGGGEDRAVFLTWSNGARHLSASGLPTCPRCAVEWDHACEERDGPLPP